MEAIPSGLEEKRDKLHVVSFSLMDVHKEKKRQEGQQEIAKDMV